MKISRDEAFAFVVVSCDNYSDLWEPFFGLFDKYWPIRNFNTYLISNHLSYSKNGIVNIRVGDDISYSDNLKKALNSIKEDYIFLWLEDLFLSDFVNVDRFNSCYQTFLDQSAGYLKLAPDMPLAYQEIENNFGELPKGIKYRAAIGATIYKKEVLQKLLLPGANAWEIDKGHESDNLKDIFLAPTPNELNTLPLNYVNVLIKGKWSRPSIKFLKSEGYGHVLINRSKESVFSWLYALIYQLRLKIYIYLRIYWR